MKLDQFLTHHKLHLLNCLPFNKPTLAPLVGADEYYTSPTSVPGGGICQLAWRPAPLPVGQLPATPPPPPPR